MRDVPPTTVAVDVQVRLSVPLGPLFPGPPRSVGAALAWLLVAVRKLRTGQASCFFRKSLKSKF